MTGKAKYTDDFQETGTLHAKMLTSPYAHADIVSMDFSEAWKIPGVRAILGMNLFRLQVRKLKTDRRLLTKGSDTMVSRLLLLLRKIRLQLKRPRMPSKYPINLFPSSIPREAFQRMRRSFMNMRTAMRRQRCIPGSEDKYRKPG